MTSEELKAMLPSWVTIEWLRENSVEEGECWIWTGHTSHAGYPVIHIDKGHTLVRRIVAVLADKPFKAGQPVRTLCRCRQCVNPDHVRPSSFKEIGRIAATRGGWKSAARAAKISAARLATSTISDEAVREIRLAKRGEVKKVADALGLNYHTAKAIRINRIRRDYSSPWAGMGARC